MSSGSSGLYAVCYGVSFSFDTNKDRDFNFAVYKGNALQPHMQQATFSTHKGQILNLVISGLLNLSENDVLSVRVIGSDSLTITIDTQWFYILRVNNN